MHLILIISLDSWMRRVGVEHVMEEMTDEKIREQGPSDLIRERRDKFLHNG